jgi:hypothetical protein
MRLVVYLSGNCSTPQFHHKQDTAVGTVEVPAEHEQDIRDLISPDRRKGTLPCIALDKISDFVYDADIPTVWAMLMYCAQFSDFVHVEE